MADIVFVLLFIFQGVVVSQCEIIVFSVHQIHHEQKLSIRVYLLIVDGQLLVEHHLSVRLAFDRELHRSFFDPWRLFFLAFVLAYTLVLTSILQERQRRL
jgi:hypothetical protein